ncbi:hypothetical protein AXF42_Ash017785 [Apostasia shenzhenica]|uniref:Uncharacterized protein n=1 Tax=Apostasia shenzhenica TaxID=1088818 RepID=A0A2I0B693_9ASPA|nr:hypothetical protein AXF42_Ash017785 [Apostasia shenzhenica]
MLVRRIAKEGEREGLQRLGRGPVILLRTCEEEPFYFVREVEEKKPMKRKG